MPEYWVVDIAARAVEVYTEPAPEGYARVRRAAAGERVGPAAFAQVLIAVGDLFP